MPRPQFTSRTVLPKPFRTTALPFRRAKKPFMASQASSFARLRSSPSGRSGAKENWASRTLTSLPRGRRSRLKSVPQAAQATKGVSAPPGVLQTGHREGMTMGGSASWVSPGPGDGGAPG
jgi:hypothetical protein